MTLKDIDWLCEKIEAHSQYKQIFAKIGSDYRLWVFWALEHRFIWLDESPPTAGLIARPVNAHMVYNWNEYPESELLYIFDHTGTGMWMDFLWGKHKLSQVLTFIESTGKQWAGWEHRKTNAPHLRSIKSLRRTHFRLH